MKEPAPSRQWQQHWTGDRTCTEDAGHEAEGELRGEEREEPGRRVEAGADLVLLQVVVQLAVVVVQQPGQLVHLNLRGGGEEKTRGRVYKTTDVRFDKALEDRGKGSSARAVKACRDMRGDRTFAPAAPPATPGLKQCARQ